MGNHIKMASTGWAPALIVTAEAVGESIGWGVAQVQSWFPELTTSLPADQAINDLVALVA